MSIERFKTVFSDVDCVHGGRKCNHIVPDAGTISLRNEDGSC